MSDAPKVRVRFAPSPTGYLHIGGVRTALYCWLYAKQKGGDFILRIEDTDQERSTDEAVQVVLDAMQWLGLDWSEGPTVDGAPTLGGGDHGPYFQTQRKHLYAEYADKLIADGKAYRCYASKKEIHEARQAFEKEHGKGFKFQSPWRDRDASEGDPSAPHSIRFKAPKTGVTGWVDKVKGRIDVPNDTQQDFILMRSDGLPLYNFGCVVDDHAMGITLVVRGDDHVINTAPQILLYEALGATSPEFGHLPMVLGKNGKKLSKRNTEVAVAALDYRDLGYLPDAVLNYLARLGWSHGDQEIFTRDELIAKFDWEHVGSNASKYDLKKFLHVQSQHLRMLDEDTLATMVVPFLKARGLEVAADNATLRAALGPVKLRAATFIELADGLDYFFRDDVTYEEKAKKKFLKPELAGNLEKLAEIVESASAFDEETLERDVLAWTEPAELKMKFVAQPARVAMTGRTRSPGLYETMVLLGRDKTIARLRAAAEVAKQAEPA